jgi:hypothetical protein
MCEGMNVLDVTEWRQDRALLSWAYNLAWVEKKSVSCVPDLVGKSAPGGLAGFRAQESPKCVNFPFLELACAAFLGCDRTCDWKTSPSFFLSHPKYYGKGPYHESVCNTILWDLLKSVITSGILYCGGSVTYHTYQKRKTQLEE